jgi:hypothetical protein
VKKWRSGGVEEWRSRVEKKKEESEGFEERRGWGLTVAWGIPPLFLFSHLTFERRSLSFAATSLSN